MFRNWLDARDERRARRGDATKKTSDLVLDAELAFSSALPISDLAEFCDVAEAAAADPTFFDPPPGAVEGAECRDEWITFPSSLSSDLDRNNEVRAKVTKVKGSDHALIVFHHWNAQSRQPTLARFFAWQGITVVEIAMPYHLERSRPGAANADDIFSPNLGRTLRSMRQAVLDGRQLIAILKERGYSKVSVLGMSLGSWVAGLIAAHDRTVGRAALFLTAGSLADMAWTGRATRHIRKSLEGEIDRADFRRAWKSLDLGYHAEKLARDDLDLLILLAKRDTVVPPHLSEDLIVKLRAAGATPEVMRLNCGHYTLSLPPYILRAGLGVSRLLKRGD